MCAWDEWPESNGNVNRVVCEDSLNEPTVRGGEKKKCFKGLVSLALVTNIRFYVVVARKSPETRCESRDFINGTWAGEIVPTLRTQLHAVDQADDPKQT